MARSSFLPIHGDPNDPAPLTNSHSMPLAHPTSATPTSNFGEPAIAISFALARPGETVKDFQVRIASRGEWGQSMNGRDKVELVLTRESVERLVGMLGSGLSL
jgi:hypothetical protein